MGLFSDYEAVPTVYFAKRILAGNEILENGAIRVDRGVITNIGPKSGIRQQGDRIINLGNLTLLPGFINIHTKLEESPLREQLSYTHRSTFTYRKKAQELLLELSKEQIEHSISLTVRESLANGITTLVTDSTMLSEEFISSQYGEIIPLIDSSHITGTTQFSFARNVGLEIDRQPQSRGFTAPHLFTHHPRYLKEAQRLIHRNRYAFQMVLNESRDELSAFVEHQGELFDEITQDGPWPFGEDRNSPAKIAITNSLIPRYSTILHPHYCGTDEIVGFQSLSATAGIAPRYTQFFDLRPFPVATALENRLNLAVCTASPALCMSMNLLDELYEIRTAHPTIPAVDLIDMITRNPAKALRLDSELGSLEIGKRANIIGIRSNELSKSPLEDLIQGEISVECVIVNGEDLILP